ncbi:hypothetical protein H2198_008048 [Neophaeococcomyces mojaviensis]|uniref:Uncharacterized protein n=1 Tax=Neophaeococcomyces mojaviensis TaxID=3383035 RepID=A0ACC2ZYA0_9EURO|nr:hypothetical protein H2198_008048 [Knufia sp. JES_112]
MEQDYISQPLQQVSPDRINQLRIPQSPSVPAYLNENAEPQPRRRDSEICVTTDVRSKIAFLNNISNSHNGSGNTHTNSFAIAGSPTRSPVRSAYYSPTKSHSRANSTFSLPADPSEMASLIQSLQAQLEQSRNRERLVAERVESLMEQLTSAHARVRHEKQAYEKEIKSLNRMQYKSELALIKCQEELREARNEQEGFKTRAEHERQAKEKARQEAFERARTLASNMEELEVAKKERDVLQTENEALKALQNSLSLATQEEVRPECCEIGVQVKLETTQEEEVASERPAACTCSENQQPTIEDFGSTESEEMQELQDELAWVRSQLKREQDLVHFMNMQCQFRACPCRQAENTGIRFVHDHEYDERQKALAEAKGLKRKAEDELPLPQYISLKKVFGLGKGKTLAEPPQQENLLEDVAMTPLPEQEDHQAEQLEIQLEDDSTLRALSEYPTMAENTTAGVVALEEAAEIPLPSPHSDDLEPTAILEDMTQVMVEPEPAATSNHFAFSTSTSSRKPLELQTPVLRQSHSAIPVGTTDDLFDIAPPRHHLPPRPSTVMGIRTTDSPIRMVPASPRHNVSLTPTTSPPRHRSVQVPLKGETSPLRNAITQQQSRSRHRERSRARSPTPGTTLPDSTSPSTATYFPITPKSRIERQHRQFHIQSHSQLHQLQTQTSTTTTMVPLRGFEDDDVFSPEKTCQTYDRAHTQPVSTDLLDHGAQSQVESAINTHQSSIMLPGTPITREAALAQIRARRDRARSDNMRKLNIVENEESGRVKTPRSVARRGVMLNRDGRDISNLSQASAPARF